MGGLAATAALVLPGAATLVLVATTASSAQTTTATTIAATTTTTVSTGPKVVLVPPGPATFLPVTTTTLTPAATAVTPTPADQLLVTGTCFAMFELQDLAAQAANTYATWPGAPPAGVTVNGTSGPRGVVVLQLCDLPDLHIAVSAPTGTGRCTGPSR